MKFIHKISKITSYIIKICLLIFVLAPSSLWGEVHPVPHKRVSDSASFLQFLRQNMGSQPAGARLFRGTLATDMPGYAVFFSHRRRGPRPRQIYIARKHNANSIAQHNPLLGGHPLNMSFQEHTERQLIIKLIAEELNIPMHSLLARNVCQSLPNIDQRLATLRGEFHIYTPAAPCAAPQIENNQFSCIEYYRVLQQKLPNCTFHVYFRTTTLDNNIANSSQQALNLINSITAMLNSGVALGHYFRMNGTTLQYNSSRSQQPTWHDVPRITLQTRLDPSTIAELRTILRRAQTMVNDQTINNRNTILENLHHIQNMTYHVL